MEYEVLKHYGIRGMRWGVLRYQNRDGTLTPAGKKRYAKDLAKVREQEKILKNKQATKAKLDALEARKKAVAEGNRDLDGDPKPSKKGNTAPDSKPKKRSIKELSDDELRSKIERIRLEQTYKELATPKNQKKSGKGKEFVGHILSTSGKNLATQVVNQVGATLLNKAFANTEFGKSDSDGNPVDVIFANNKKKDK